MVLIAPTHHMHHHHRTQVEHANHMGGFTQTLGNTIPNISQEMMDILEDRLQVHLTTLVIHHHIIDHLLVGVLMAHIMDHIMDQPLMERQVDHPLDHLPADHLLDHLPVDHP